MKLKAVITGDVVKSSMALSNRETMLKALDDICKTLKNYTSLEYEIFRGDSFQLLLSDPVQAMMVAIVLRSSFKASTPKGTKVIWDVRESIGIGKVEYLNDKIGLSDGEAFHLSGHELDQIGQFRLAIKTPWKDINSELLVSTAFLDNLITGWTKTKAKVISESLLNKHNQIKISSLIGTSQQNVSKRLIAARYYLVELYLKRYQELIKKYCE